MADADITDDEVAGLIRLTADAASALIRGDVRGYLTLIRHADDYTLMAPAGGETKRGFDTSDQALEALAQFFQGGEAELEIVETYTSGNLVVLVLVERQHVKVGGLPDQALSGSSTLSVVAAIATRSPA